MSGLFDEHLTLDAVVAYADGEMGMTAYKRAAAHVMHCGACAADVAEQATASQYLRQARMPSMPGGLLDALRSIPVALPQLSDPAPGTPGRPFESHPRSADEAEHGRGRRFRLGAGALVAGLAVGAVMVTAVGDQPTGVPTAPLRPDTASVSGASAIRTTVLDVLARTPRH